MANQFPEWTDENIQFLKDNYLNMSDEEIGIILNKSKGGIKTKRSRLKLKHEKPLLTSKTEEKLNLYTEEASKEQLVRIFNELKRIPTQDDAKLYKMKPSREWYVHKYGSVEKACACFGLIEKPLSVEERMDISIVELREIAKELGRIPFCDEYLAMKDKGYSEYPLQKHFNLKYSEICEEYLKDFKVQEGYKKCSVCGEIKLISDYGIDNDAPLGLRCSCRLCEYIKRIDQLNIVDDWTKEEFMIIIDNILNEKVTYINELCEILHRELEDIIDVLNNHIKIGNKPLNIKVKCAYCGIEESKTLSIYLKNKEYFCSYDCYWKFKKEFEPKGEDHPNYDRVKIKCDNCNKDIQVIPWNIENHQHNFCSQKCYWKFRSKYYIGEKHPQFGLKKTVEQKRKMSIITTARYTNGSFKRITKPQIGVNNILTELNMEYINEYNCKYYAIDNYLSDYNLMIEVNGDYFHSNPLKFSKLNTMQIKGITRDKRKRTYIKKYKEIDVLYLWESDINDNPEMCKELILEYVNNKGILSNYNSFNYSLVEEKLVLNKDIVIPYTDWDIKHINEIKKLVV